MISLEGIVLPYFVDLEKEKVGTICKAKDTRKMQPT